MLVRDWIFTFSQDIVMWLSGYCNGITDDHHLLLMHGLELESLARSLA
jgi:hypothetical protein